jgi:arylformamidase
MNADGIDRRSMMAAAGAAGALAFASGPAAAQRCGMPAPRSKGPAVWLDMDQQELDEAYNQAIYAFNSPAISERVRVANVRALASIGAPERGSYGEAEIEKLKIYKTARAGAPTLVYIHGGAWGTSSFDDTAFMAEVLIKAGVNFIHVEFSNVDTVGGDLFPMADQCRRAVAWVYRNAANFGGNRERLYLAGHSSGAHLGGCVLTTDWAKLDLPVSPVKGAILASGMYDLKPVRLSNRSSYVKFTDAMEHELSPQRHSGKISAPVTLLYGTLETPEFQRHTRDFAAALTAAGKNVRVLAGKGLNHFEVAETLGNPYGFMGRAALEMMGIAS